MWFQQPDAFTHVQFVWNVAQTSSLKCFERSDLYYKTHEVTRCKQPLYIFMLFFIKMKLSSRLCLTHKRVTQKYRNSTLIKKKKKKKKNCTRIGSESAILRIFWIGSDRIWKNGIVASLNIMQLNVSSHILYLTFSIQRSSPYPTEYFILLFTELMSHFSLSDRAVYHHMASVLHNYHEVWASSPWKEDTGEEKTKNCNINRDQR